MDSLWGAGGKVHRCNGERPRSLQLSFARQMLTDTGVEHWCSLTLAEMFINITLWFWIIMYVYRQNITENKSGHD